MSYSDRENLLNLHLMILKEIFKGKPISEIITEHEKNIEDLNYLTIAKNNNLLTYDENGVLIGAYPVSPFKTSFKVDIENIGSGYCMCAIDALGIAYTFNEKTIIKATDKTTNKEITIKVDPAIDAVESDRDFWVTYKDPDMVQNIAKDQCPVINFYSSKESITLGKDFVIFSFEDALRHAKSIFSQEAMKKSFSNGFKAIPKENIIEN